MVDRSIIKSVEGYLSALDDKGIIDSLWHITAKTDSRIEPVACGEKQWQEDDSSAIIEIARREGEIVRIRNVSLI